MKNNHLEAFQSPTCTCIELETSCQPKYKYHCTTTRSSFCLLRLAWILSSPDVGPKTAIVTIYTYLSMRASLPSSDGRQYTTSPLHQTPASQLNTKIPKMKKPGHSFNTLGKCRKVFVVRCRWCQNQHQSRLYFDRSISASAMTKLAPSLLDVRLLSPHLLFLVHWLLDPRIAQKSSPKINILLIRFTINLS